MENKLFIKVLLSVFLGLLSFSPVFAQTVRLVPQNIETDLSSAFSVTLNIESVTDLFGVALDLDFDPSLVNFVSAEKGDFMSSDGCETSLMASENPSGKLIVGLVRMGSEFGGISGSGTLITFNFVSLSKAGTNNFSFSNNSLCIFSDAGCDYQTGTWVASSVVVVEPVTDVIAPVCSDGLPAGQFSSGTTQTTLSLSTNENATCKYTTSSGISYDSMSNTFSTTGGTSHSVSLLSLTDGSIYNYYIKCKDSTGNKNTSDYIVSFSVATATVVPDTTSPSVPTNLSASVISDSQINLSWSASTDNIGVYSYHIHRNGSLIDSITGTFYSNTGLLPNTSYAYAISALDVAGNESQKSSAINAITQAIGEEEEEEEDPPAEDPPAEDPPAEDPPAEDPPAEDPPAEDPPVNGEEEEEEEEGPTISELKARIVELISQIQKLQVLLAQMTGTSEIPANYKFSNTLRLRDYSNDVKYLQIFLNLDPYTKVAVSGPGSPDKETKYFGYLTRTSVIKFQEKYAQEVLSPWHLSRGTGVVGGTTIAKINQILGK